MAVGKFEPREYLQRTLRTNKSGEVYFIYKKRKIYPDKKRGKIQLNKSTIIQYELYLPKNLATIDVYKKI